MPALPLVNTLKHHSGNIGRFMAIGRKLGEYMVHTRLREFGRYIMGPRILDVGVGAGSMAYVLTEKGYVVTGIDVVNSSLYEDIQPVIYDGIHVPFATKSYETGFLICVLHHCSDPLAVLSETMRVCRRIIIIEDTYRNLLERFLIAARDRVGNFEFFGHTYHTTHEWQKIFRKKGWRTIHTSEWSSITFYGMYGRQTLFIIEPYRKR